MLDIVPTIVSYTEKSFDVDVFLGKFKFKFINNERHHSTPPLNFPADRVKRKSCRLQPDLVKSSRAA